MARKIVAGNWKMNLVFSQVEELVHNIVETEKDKDVRVIVFPPSLFVNKSMDASQRKIDVGIQSFSEYSSGAHTGEISIKQGISCGANIGLIGHSERRSDNGETNEVLKLKVDAAISENFEFIFCCGEPQEIREANKELDFVKNQLESSLFHIEADKMKDAIIAYEPVWAIGTGLTASSDQAEEMHKNIRLWIEEKYNSDIANSVSILYGGSCKPSNAVEIFSCPNVDGGLIGGASLDSNDFCSIINAF